MGTPSDFRHYQVGKARAAARAADSGVVGLVTWGG